MDTTGSQRFMLAWRCCKNVNGPALSPHGGVKKCGLDPRGNVRNRFSVSIDNGDLTTCNDAKHV